MNFPAFYKPEFLSFAQPLDTQNCIDSSSFSFYYTTAPSTDNSIEAGMNKHA